MSNPYSSYLDAAVLSANPIEVVRILYRAALDSVNDARAHLGAGEVTERSTPINKAVSILRELVLAVNHEPSPNLARNLVELYDYMQRRVLAGHFSQADAPLAEVAGLLGSMLEAWERVDCQSGSEGPGASVASERTQEILAEF